MSIIPSFGRAGRSPTFYALILTAVVIAAGVLAYLTYVTAMQQEKLNERSIISSTLALVREKVDQLERRIIGDDNSVFQLVNFDDLTSLDTDFERFAGETRSAITDVLIIDHTHRVVRAVSTSNAREAKKLHRVFLQQALPLLGDAALPTESLRHLHEHIAGEDYLFSYLVRIHDDERYLLVAHHSTQLLVSQSLPELLTTPGSLQLYNVVDDADRRVYGENLALAGDYIVGRRFPTTLYRWRLQIAPAQAPLLSEQRRARKYWPVLLLGLSFSVITFGVAFIVAGAVKERRLNALRTEFVGNVSHELKTPLSVIRMYSEMLLSGRVPHSDKQQDYLKTIHLESERLSSLVENVLDFSALEQGKQVYKLVPTQLSDVIRQSVETFNYRIRLDPVDLRLIVPEGLPAVLADAQALVLAILNLLDNAYKYGDASTITLEVSHRDDKVVLSVSDKGPGFVPTDIESVFDRFFRSQHPHPVRGSGIGLSLVKHIIDAHHGTVRASNRQNGGAEVSVTLPVVADPGQTQAV